jgi:hypothetical protein
MCKCANYNVYEWIVEQMKFHLLSHLLSIQGVKSMLVHENYCSLCRWPKCEHFEAQLIFPSKPNFCNQFEFPTTKFIQ